MDASAINTYWNRLNSFPGGRYLFSKTLGWLIPYTGSTKPQVLVIKEGVAKVRLKDRRRVRNHLHCLHAIALVNVGELSTGLALYSRFSKGMKGIPTKLSIEYFKKARGTITATAKAPKPDRNQEKEYEIESILTNEAGETVSRVTANWRVRPPKTEN